MKIHHLDITEERCPMTFVKIKIALNRLQAGDILKVKVTGGEPLENIPRTAAEQGFNVLSEKESETAGVFIIEIEK